MSSDFNWSKIDKKYWSPITIFLFTALHIAYINTPFVNLEWVYRFGSQFFITNEKSYLEAYFADQANTIIYSYSITESPFRPFRSHVFVDNLNEKLRVLLEKM